MDYLGLVIIILILIYGAVIYKRREQLHRELLRYLMQGEKPPELTAMQQAWKLVTAGSIALSVLLAAWYFAVLGIRNMHTTAAPSIVALCLGGVVVLLFRGFLQDLKKYRELRETAREVLL